MHFTLRSATLLLGLWIALSPAAAGFGQDPDGPKHIFVDALLDHLVGNWNSPEMSWGAPRSTLWPSNGCSTINSCASTKKTNAPATNDRVPYEAMIMVGYDNTSDRYVAHWNDVFGGRFFGNAGLWHSIW